jgi:hypothetical protein
MDKTNKYDLIAMLKTFKSCYKFKSGIICLKSHRNDTNIFILVL